MPRLLFLLSFSNLVIGTGAFVVGGVVPDEDVPARRAMGVADVILQDTPPDEVVARLKERFGR